jgi:Gnt-I system high-affinity gluconate transporter
MSLILVLCCIGLLVLLISGLKINAFLSFLLVSILAGILLGMPLPNILPAIKKGIGDMLGELLMVVLCGAMLGKLAAESGAAQQIASSLMKLSGKRYIQWALMGTAFIIGIPLFYNVGFVLVVPLIFSVAYKYKFPTVFIGIPMLSALSVTHGFLPPHPSPAALVDRLHADMGTTLLYGIIVAIPTVVLAGPVFARTLRRLHSPVPETFQPDSVVPINPPGVLTSIISSLFPVILLAVTAALGSVIAKESPEGVILAMISSPAMVMILSLAVATFSLGIAQGMSMKKVMGVYAEAASDIAMLLFIMGGAGALKEILSQSGADKEIGQLLNSLHVHPLILGWAIACVIRVCVGSATVAGLTTASIIAPLMTITTVNPSLMVLAVGAGSLMFSHVNDAGFWMFKEYFNLSIKDTIRSWSLMETIVGIAGLVGVLILNIFV